jgi:hypothetical protein
MVITNDDRMMKMMTMQLEQQWGILRNGDGIRMRKIPRNNENETRGQWKPMRDGEEM